MAKATLPSAIRKSQLEKLKAHSELQSVLDSPPRVTQHEKGFGCGFVGAILGPLVIIVFAFVFLANASGGPVRAGSSGSSIFVLVPVLIIAAAGFKIFQAANSAASFENAPVEPRLSVIVDERVEVKGGGEDQAATTLYYTTIEDETSHREEFEVGRATAGKISVGDAGVAWVKGTALIQFRRFVL